MSCRHLIAMSFAAVALLSAAPFRSSALASFADGDFVTYWQNSWGEAPNGTNAASLLFANYTSVYSGAGGLLEVGLPGKSITFTSASFVNDFLPAAGPPGPLTAINDNPSSTNAGFFGGDVVALKLNVDFSDAGLTQGTLGIPFGDLVLQNFDTLPLLNGVTVHEFLDGTSTVLGNGTWHYPLADLLAVLDDMNLSFQDGVVSTFAQDHLAIVPEPATAGLALVGFVGLVSRCRRSAAGSVRTSNY